MLSFPFLIHHQIMLRILCSAAIVAVAMADTELPGIYTTDGDLQIRAPGSAKFARLKEQVVTSEDIERTNAQHKSEGEGFATDIGNLVESDAIITGGIQDADGIEYRKEGGRNGASVARQLYRVIPKKDLADRILMRILKRYEEELPYKMSAWKYAHNINGEELGLELQGLVILGLNQEWTFEGLGSYQLLM